MNNNLVGVQINDLQTLNTDNSLPDLTNMTGADVTMNMWGIKPALIKELSNMNKVYSSKHGLFAGVPIVCKDKDCVYQDICMVSPKHRTKGQRCPMEIAAILSRYEQWCAHFEIDTVDDVIDTKDLVDATLIKDLVNVEVQMLRAENKIALNGDFMTTTLLEVDKKCNAYYGKIVSPETEFLMQLQDKKIKILNQLNATRKDKAADKRKESASDEAIRIFQQVKEMQKTQQLINISDVSFEEDGTVIEPEKTADVMEIVERGDENGTSSETT